MTTIIPNGIKITPKKKDTTINNENENEKEKKKAEIMELMEEDEIVLNAERMISEAEDTLAYYDLENNAYIVPLYDTEDDSKSCDIEPDTVITWYTCSKCNHELTLVQGSIDALYMEAYNTDYDVFGICTNCGELIDLTSDIRYLL